MRLTNDQMKDLQRYLKKNMSAIEYFEGTESRREDGIVSESRDVSGYSAVVLYIQQGMGDEEEILRQVLRVVEQVQHQGRFRYPVFLFSYGGDEGQLYPGSRNSPRGYSARPDEWVRELCALAGVVKPAVPPIVTSLFPPGNTCRLKGEAQRKALYLFFCRDQGVRVLTPANGQKPLYKDVKKNSIWVFCGDSAAELAMGGFTPNITQDGTVLSTGVHGAQETSAITKAAVVTTEESEEDTFIFDTNEETTSGIVWQPNEVKSSKSPTGKDAALNICNGWNDIIDRNLGVQDIGASPHFVHKKSALRLSNAAPAQFDAQKLLDEMMSCLESNWQASPRRDTHGPSDENWRFIKKRDIASDNPSLEKTLEKALVNEPFADAENWVNQVPTASGLLTWKSDRHRNIDLVHRQKRGEYQFIELKVGSNNPLMAAMEVVHYAILYTFASLNYTKTQLQAKELLQADTIHLWVLAPLNFYKGYDFEWLVPALNSGLQTFLARRTLPFKMDFQFMAFAADFQWSCDSKQCSAVFEAISPVVWK